MPLVTAVSVGAKGYGWSSGSAEINIIWSFSSYGGSTAIADSTVGASLGGAVGALHSAYAVPPVNTFYYWPNIESNTTGSTYVKGENLHASGIGYFNGLFWQLGGSSSEYHTFSDNSVYSFNGTSWTARSNLPYASNRSSAAYDENSAMYFMTGGKDNSAGRNVFYRLNSTTGSWTAMANLPKTYRQSLYPAYTSGGFVSITNDWTDTSYDFLRYSIASNTWSNLGTAPTTNLGGFAQDSRFHLIDYSTNIVYTIKDTENLWSVGSAVSGSYSGFVVAINNRAYSVGSGTRTPAP